MYVHCTSNTQREVISASDVKLRTVVYRHITESSHEYRMELFMTSLLEILSKTYDVP